MTVMLRKIAVPEIVLHQIDMNNKEIGSTNRVFR
jgi:hypothetical protein